MQSASISLDLCDHCGNDIAPQALVEAPSGRFCCQGCRVVKENLTANGLEDFYLYRNLELVPVSDYVHKDDKFAYLNDLDFQRNKFERRDDLIALRFYIEGARCQACLWVMEKIPDMLPFVQRARFSLDKSVLEVWVQEGEGLSQLPKLIQSFGYRPHLVFEDSGARELKRKEKRRELARLGVAFACSGNIMLLAISVYAGLEGALKEWFDFASMLIAIPSVTYCSMPFYRSTVRAFRSKTFSIDVSVAVGIVFGYLIGAYHVFSGSGEVYFDTLAILVFLLLGSRYLLDAARDKGMDASEVRSFFSNISAKKLMPDGSLKEVHASLLAPGDVVEIAPGDLAPLDSEVVAGESYVNESVLTGESFPVRKSEGDKLFGGSENQSSVLRARVLTSAKDSKMGQLMERLQQNWGKQTRLARLSDQFSKKVVIAVSVLAVGVILYYSLQGGVDIGLQRALAMIIITCPCALGFNIPISMMIGMKKFAKQGIILKDDNVVEKVAQAQNVFLDKTGTVTSGHREVLLEWVEKPAPRELFSLEARSKHPLATAVMESLTGEFGPIEVLPMEEYQEIPGKGPKARMQNSHFYIAPLDKVGGVFGFYQDGRLMAKGRAQDELDEAFVATAKELRDAGKNVFLLSGDGKERVEAVEKAAGGAIKKSHWGAQPLEKEKIVSETPHSLMVGDGVNDALALKAASVGIAATGGVDMALASSEVYFCSGGVENLLKLIEGCEWLIRVVKTNVGLALIYNVIFIILALTGWITPLAAAILMPISSLLLLSVSLGMLNRMDKKLIK